jgi:hypothetical protein
VIEKDIPCGERKCICFVLLVAAFFFFLGVLAGAAVMGSAGMIQ